MLQNDELLQRIGYLERTNRFWKGLSFALGAALFLILALGTGLGVSLYLGHISRQAELETAVRQAFEDEAVARQRAVEAQKAAEKAVEKSAW